MKEREQKTAAQAAGCLQGDRLEAEELAGVQTFMEITENELVEVQMPRSTLKRWINGYADAYGCVYGKAGRNRVRASRILSSAESNHIGQESTGTVVKGIGQMPRA